MTTKLDTLAFLQEQFAAIPPRTAEIDGFPAKLVFRPLTPEQSIKLAKALREAKAPLQALAYAELLVDTVTLEDGSPAFPLVRGGPNPVEVLTKRTPSRVFTALVNRLIDWLLSDSE